MLHELETALQRELDPDTLAVYADALEAVGDPRGELISLDLRRVEAVAAESPDPSDVPAIGERELTGGPLPSRACEAKLGRGAQVRISRYWGW